MKTIHSGAWPLMKDWISGHRKAFGPRDFREVESWQFIKGGCGRLMFIEITHHYLFILVMFWDQVTWWYCYMEDVSKIFADLNGVENLELVLGLCFIFNKQTYKPR